MRHRSGAEHNSGQRQGHRMGKSVEEGTADSLEGAWPCCDSISCPLTFASMSLIDKSSNLVRLKEGHTPGLESLPHLEPAALCHASHQTQMLRSFQGTNLSQTQSHPPVPMYLCHSQQPTASCTPILSSCSDEEGGSMDGLNATGISATIVVNTPSPPTAAEAGTYSSITSKSATTATSSVSSSGTAQISSNSSCSSNNSTSDCSSNRFQAEVVTTTSTSTATILSAAHLPSSHLLALPHHVLGAVVSHLTWTSGCGLLSASKHTRAAGLLHLQGCVRLRPHSLPTPPGTHTMQSMPNAHSTHSTGCEADLKLSGLRFLMRRRQQSEVHLKLEGCNGGQVASMLAAVMEGDEEQTGLTEPQVGAQGCRDLNGSPAAKSSSCELDIQDGVAGSRIASSDSCGILAHGSCGGAAGLVSSQEAPSSSSLSLVIMGGLSHYDPSHLCLFPHAFPTLSHLALGRAPLPTAAAFLVAASLCPHLRHVSLGEVDNTALASLLTLPHLHTVGCEQWTVRHSPGTPLPHCSWGRLAIRGHPYHRRCDYLLVDCTSSSPVQLPTGIKHLEVQRVMLVTGGTGSNTEAAVQAGLRALTHHAQRVTPLQGQLILCLSPRTDTCASSGHQLHLLPALATGLAPLGMHLRWLILERCPAPSLGAHELSLLAGSFPNLINLDLECVHLSHCFLHALSTSLPRLRQCSITYQHMATSPDDLARFCTHSSRSMDLVLERRVAPFEGEAAYFIRRALQAVSERLGRAGAPVRLFVFDQMS